MKLISVVGARPQFVKLGPISRAASCHNADASCSEGVEHVVVHTGQHYDVQMSKAFFDQMSLPAPYVNLEVGSGPHGEQTGRMLERLERVFLDEQPDAVIVYGDTNSTVAAALAAAKLMIPVAHVEAGLRSHRKAMPEEVNRVLTDHVSSFLLCPTTSSADNLRSEGLGEPRFEGDLAPLGLLDCPWIPAIDHPWLVNVGDVMKDALLHEVRNAQANSSILTDLGLGDRDFAVATVHRAENTDEPARLRSILDALGRIAAEDLPVVFPVHPRTRRALQRASLRIPGSMVCMDAVPYWDMLQLLSRAVLALTDSGGLQKEAFMLGVPCVTLRDETEWVELAGMGWNVVAGTSAERIVRSCRTLLTNRPSRPSSQPYGDGQAAVRIIQTLMSWRRNV